MKAFSKIQISNLENVEIDNNNNNKIFVAASHQTGLDTRSMNRRPIIVEI